MGAQNSVSAHAKQMSQRWSNMQLAMAGACDADADIADSGNYPLMRFATIKMQAYTTPVSFHTLISDRRTVGN